MSEHQAYESRGPLSECTLERIESYARHQQTTPHALVLRLVEEVRGWRMAEKVEQAMQDIEYAVPTHDGWTEYNPDAVSAMARFESIAPSKADYSSMANLGKAMADDMMKQFCDLLDAPEPDVTIDR